VASLDSYSRLSTRCLPPLGPAAQEGARAVAAVQTQRAPNQPPLVVSSQGHLPQVVKLPPLLPSSRPAVRLRVRRMRELLPPGGQGWTQSLLTSTLTDLRCLGLLDNYYWKLICAANRTSFTMVFGKSFTVPRGALVSPSCRWSHCDTALEVLFLNASNAQRIGTSKWKCGQWSILKSRRGENHPSPPSCVFQYLMNINQLQCNFQLLFNVEKMFISVHISWALPPLYLSKCKQNYLNNL